MEYYIKMIPCILQSFRFIWLDVVYNIYSKRVDEFAKTKVIAHSSAMSKRKTSNYAVGCLKNKLDVPIGIIRDILAIDFTFDDAMSIKLFGCVAARFVHGWSCSFGFIHDIHIKCADIIIMHGLFLYRLPKYILLTSFSNFSIAVLSIASHSIDCSPWRGLYSFD